MRILKKVNVDSYVRKKSSCFSLPSERISSEIQWEGFGVFTLILWNVNIFFQGKDDTSISKFII